MDLFTRAVDWVVTRKGAEETASVILPPVNWEELPGDVFSVLLPHFDSQVDYQALKNVRCVCRTWRRHVDSHLQHLPIQLNAHVADWQFSKTFSTIRSLAIHAAFDAVPQNALLIKEIANCTQLRKLVLRNCKGKIMDGLQHLRCMDRLMKLHVDGNVFLKMKTDDIALPQVQTLVIHNCSKFSSPDYNHIAKFMSLNRLVLTQASEDWKYGAFLSALSKLSDLVVMSFATITEPVFYCLKAVTHLRRLVLFNPGLGIASLKSLPVMPFLEQLSIDGVATLTPQYLQCVASKFPRLTSLTIGCQSEVWIPEYFVLLPETPMLKTLRLIGCESLDNPSFRAAFRSDVNVSFVTTPTLDLASQRSACTISYDDLEKILKSVGYPDFPEAPLVGDYFTPALLSKLVVDGRYDLVKLLVSYGADIDYGSPIYAGEGEVRYDCSTALHFAVHRGDEKAVRELLNLGARVNAHCTEDARTPLHLAASSGNLEITKILLLAQANVNAVDGFNRTPLHAAVTWRAYDVITELLHHGADPQIVDMDLMSPMCYAARMADLDLLQFLYQNGMDVNDGAAYEFVSPLHVAVRNGMWKVVRFLLEHGADPCAKDIDGTMPLISAAQHGHRKLVDSLLQSLEPHRDVLNERDNLGMTILHYAALKGWLEVVERLIQLGVDVNRTDPRGFTALYYADVERHTKIVARLTREGGLARWLVTPKLYRCKRMKLYCGSDSL